MILREETPCDYCGICPYGVIDSRDCIYWCGADEPQDDYEGDIEDESC